jgi:hypothetical protein
MAPIEQQPCISSSGDAIARLIWEKEIIYRSDLAATRSCENLRVIGLYNFIHYGDQIWNHAWKKCA